jgi:hypothetical protein
MTKKAHITVNLLPEASGASISQIEEEIKKDAKIPWCSEIEVVSVEDAEESYVELKKQGVSSNVARSVVDLYTE